MSELRVGISYVSRNEIPKSYYAVCQPPLQVLRLSAISDMKTIKKLEEEAIKLTNSFPQVTNDFGDQHLSETQVFRVTHALEHIVVLRWLIDGFIDHNLLESGTLAATLPGNGKNDEEIAAVWMREGIVSSNLFANTLLRQVQVFGGDWYYDR